MKDFDLSKCDRQLKSSLKQQEKRESPVSQVKAAMDRSSPMRESRSPQPSGRPKREGAVSSTQGDLWLELKTKTLQVAYSGDPGAALLTFATHPQAKSAHQSSEAVLGNRFIKVFWHSPDGNSEQNQGPAKKPRNERIVIPSKEKLSIVRRPVAPEKYYAVTVRVAGYRVLDSS
ncbi:putative RNA-binding protein 26 [Apostichopus japonicus]|uniref:Putative RNA-binding protein 26 n=1 Tax=Stichopus japonicus TaxID=307972 RepID=A0A2G8KNZ5_STIJA|nr:putative RNA-binding protein 26 [Apostichopus japonicus]